MIFQQVYVYLYTTKNWSLLSLGTPHHHHPFQTSTYTIRSTSNPCKPQYHSFPVPVFRSLRSVTLLRSVRFDSFRSTTFDLCRRLHPIELLDSQNRDFQPESEGKEGFLDARRFLCVGVSIFHPPCFLGVGGLLLNESPVITYRSA